MKQNPKTIKQILNISFLSVVYSVYLNTYLIVTVFRNIICPGSYPASCADLLYYQQADSCGSVRYGNPAVAGYNSYGRSFETIGNSA